VHLFGTGDAGSGCRISPALRRSLTFRLLARSLGLPRRGGTFDEGYEEVLVEAVRRSGLDRAVLLAQDGVYDGEGRLDTARTPVLVPNDHLFAVAGRHADLLVPCPSINPDRRDAIDELERCAALGARAVKIHPPIQGVDIADPRHRPFFERCAGLGVTVLVHTGHEHSSPIIDAGLADPARLAQALDCGCTVIACHCGTGWPTDRPDFLPRFLELARRKDRLFGDTAVLGTPGRVRDVRRLLEASDVRDRLVHGSDFPFPAMPIAFALRIGIVRAFRLGRERNALRRDLSLKDALGFGREGAERAFRLLAR